MLKLIMIFMLISSKQISAQTIEANSSPPHIIVIYTDDMGIGDVSYAEGQVIITPHIDQLAREGKVFTQYYTNAPVCSPSRVAITTGMYPIRWNINTFLNHRKFNKNCEQSDYLDTSAPTMARYLKSAGYATAHFGKWHMGGGRDVNDAPSIAAYGFDEFVSTYESPEPDPLLTSTDWIWAAGDSIKRWERTSYFIDKTLDFLARNAFQPCFINLWPDDVHTPWVASEDLMLEGKEMYNSMHHFKPVLEEFDIQIGRLMDELKRRGLDENTIVIFTSDNGPAPSFNRLRTNGLRGVKNSLYEGGIRMPFIVHWPGTVAAGTVDSTSVIAAMDLLPTLCKIAGASIPDDEANKMDGEDFSAALFAQNTYERKNDIFWEYGRNEFYNYPDAIDRSLQLAIRHDQWKLFTNPQGTKVELYDLSIDPNESKDLSEDYPEMTEMLKIKTVNWFEDNDQEFVSYQ